MKFKINCKPRAVAEPSCLERYESEVPVAGSMCGANLFAAAEASGNCKCRKARISLQTGSRNLEVDYSSTAEAPRDCKRSLK